MRGDREESDNAKGRDNCKMKNRGSQFVVEIARFLFEDLRLGGLDGRTNLGQTNPHGHLSDQTNKRARR